MDSSHPRDLFSEQSEFYARYRPRYPGDMYRFIFRHLDQKKTAWDCGTGSGQVAGYLSDHFDTVHATDISAGQLEHALQRENIVYSLTPAEKSGFPAGTFDLITVAQAVHWFDFEAFYREVNRVARQPGLIAVIGYGIMETDPEINLLVKELYEQAFGRFFGDRRRYVKEEYETIPFPFDEIPSPRFYIRDQWTPAHLEGFFNSWSSVQKIKSTEGHNPAEPVMEQIRQTVAEDDSIAVTFPVFLRLGRVRGTE